MVNAISIESLITDLTNEYSSFESYDEDDILANPGMSAFELEMEAGQINENIEICEMALGMDDVLNSQDIFATESTADINIPVVGKKISVSVNASKTLNDNISRFFKLLFQKIKQFFEELFNWFSRVVLKRNSSFITKNKDTLEKYYSSGEEIEIESNLMDDCASVFKSDSDAMAQSIPEICNATNKVMNDVLAGKNTGALQSLGRKAGLTPTQLFIINPNMKRLYEIFNVPKSGSDINQSTVNSGTISDAILHKYFVGDNDNAPSTSLKRIASNINDLEWILSDDAYTTAKNNYKQLKNTCDSSIKLVDKAISDRMQSASRDGVLGAVSLTDYRNMVLILVRAVMAYWRVYMKIYSDIYFVASKTIHMFDKMNQQ